MGLWSSHPARDTVSLTRREHGIGPASAWAAGEALRGEGILPSHAPQGAVLHMPVRRSARLSARGRAECPPPEGPDSEPNHRSINMLRDLLHGRERILPSPSMDGSSGPLEGRHSAFPKRQRRFPAARHRPQGPSRNPRAPSAREGRMPSPQNSPESTMEQRRAFGGTGLWREGILPSLSAEGASLLPVTDPKARRATPAPPGAREGNMPSPQAAPTPRWGRNEPLMGKRRSFGGKAFCLP